MTAKKTKKKESDKWVIETARRVLELEADSIKALSGSLNDDFCQATRMLFETKGRVVVSGMGKSGHVARKISATFASTGTPALFVHPAEASHGDLGMIASGDLLIIISNSGETSEVSDLVNYCHRFAIPLIAITGRKESALGNTANITIELPNVAEACPLGLAPTTSTTMTLALGDALAIALLDMREFSSERFQELHPGGKLGQRLIKVSDIFHSGEALPLISEDSLMSEALIEMTAKSFGCVGVINSSENLTGIITDGDLRRNMDSNLLTQKAKFVMTPNPKTITANSLASEALGRMTSTKITSLFVAENKRPIGIIHLHDCLRAGIDMQGENG